jgi:hypothetical protein
MMQARLPRIIHECRLPPLADKGPSDKHRQPNPPSPEKKDRDAEVEIITRKIIDKATREIIRNIKRWYN